MKTYATNPVEPVLQRPVIPRLKLRSLTPMHMIGETMDEHVKNIQKANLNGPKNV